jgi:hypothetical protein
VSLYSRLIGTTEPKIHVHAFMAALGELERGQMTTQQVIDAFTLSAGEQTEAAALIARVVSPLDSISLGGFLTLTNVGAAYDTTPASKGLGVCRIETFGISGFEFGVFVNKVGTGTQSWQLWDQTNAAQLAVIDDAGAAGDKTLSVSQSVSPLPAGLRTLRVRVKSTTAADDPVFYGASLALRRIGMMTADVLHQILLLAEDRINPLHTEAALIARLGV